jgi:nickel/cobalt transporter (NicO) family protein
MSSWLLMGSALALGAAHALEPVHGKTLLSVHFSGTKNRLRDALQIGLLITMLHAASITLYGAIGVGLAKTFFQSPEALVNAGSLMAGTVVLLLGGWWTWQAWATPPSCHHHEHDATLTTWNSFSRQFNLSLASSLVPCPSAIIVVVSMLTLGQTAQLTDAFTFLLVFSVGLSLTLILASTLLSIPGRHLAQQLKGVHHMAHCLKRSAPLPWFYWVAF